MNEIQNELNQATETVERLNSDINRLESEKAEKKRQIPDRDQQIESWKQEMLETGEEKPFPTVPSRETLLQDLERIEALIQVKTQALHQAQKRRDKAKNQQDIHLLSKKQQAVEHEAEAIRGQIQDELVRLWATASVNFGWGLGVEPEWSDFLSKIFPEPAKPGNWWQMVEQAKERLLSSEDQG